METNPLHRTSVRGARGLPILTVLSDLTLELVLTDTGGELYDIEIYDLHVLQVASVRPLKPLKDAP